MAARTFNPVLTRRASPGAAKTAARPATQPRTAGAAAGTPRFASRPRVEKKSAAPIAKTAPAISQRNDRWEHEARRVSTQATSTAPASPKSTYTPAAPSTTASPTLRPAVAPTSGKPVHPLNPVQKPSVSTSTFSSAPSSLTVSPARHSPPARPRFSPRENLVPATGPPSHSHNASPSLTPLSGLSASAALPDVGSLGHALSPSIRLRLESLLGADLTAVRVHTGPSAQHAAASVNARAFTVGTHIYLGRGESPSDLALLAHETAHAVQQSATLHAASPRGPPQSQQNPAPLSAAPRGMIQRWDVDDYIPDVVSDAAGAVADTAVGAVEYVGEKVAEGFWYGVDNYAPAPIASFLREVRDVGFLGMLKTRISAALDFVFAALKSQGGTCAEVATFFEALIAKAAPIFAALAAGDCKPLFAAVKNLGEMLGKMAGDAWDKLTTFLKPVGDWLTNVWTKFGAPVVDFLKEFASTTWDWITGLGEWLWDLSRPIRDFYSGAWTEIKNLLGFGEGSDEDGSGGVMGWITEKAGALWDEIKTELAPVIEPIKAAAAAISDFLPLNAILTLRDKINEWLDQATAMADGMDQPDDVAENQDLLRQIILPGIKNAIVALRGKVTAASSWVAEAIGGIITQVTGFFSTLSGNTLLSPLSGAIQWLSDEATSLGAWATDKVGALFTWADQALALLDLWIEPVLETLRKLVTALGNLMDHLGDLVLGPLLLIPKCIRDPIKDFIVTKILSKIPVFAQLVQLPDIWAKVAPAFRAAIVAVFRDGNLFRAAWVFFRSVLTLLDIPPQLVTKLIRNAAKAIKDILRGPIGFLGNVLTAMKLGLLQFIDRIGKHLLKGAVDWLLSGVKGPGIKIPDPFALTLRNVLDLVFQVLDLTKEKIFQRIEKLKGKKIADKVRKMVAVGEKVLEWITVLFNEGPAGLWKHLKTELNNLWDKMLGFVVDYLVGKIVQQATIWVTKTLASGGLSVILDAVKAVYDAIQVIAQYLKQLLEVANSVCEGVIDIAKGVLNKAADMVESAAARLIPMVLAFLARTLGIGDLPEVIGEGIQKVRKTVEDAIDSLIEKTFAAIDWLKEKGKQAIDAVLNWWKAREEIKADDGETHHVYLEGEPAAGIKLIVASDPMNAAAAIKAIGKNDELSDAEKTDFKAQATTEKDALEASIAKLEKLNTQETAGNLPSDSSRRTDELKAENGRMRERLRNLASILEKSLFATVAWKDIPKSTISPTFGTGTSSSMTAGPLSNLGSGGSEPEGGTQEPKGWPELQEAGFTTDGYRYKQMHLINARFGGEGKRNNLVPGSGQNNSDHLGSVENPLKELVGHNRNDKTKKGVIWYTATVNYGAANRGPKWPDSFLGKSGKTIRLKNVLSKADFAESIHLKWGLYKRSGKDWNKQTSAIGNFTVSPIPLPPFETK